MALLNSNTRVSTATTSAALAQYQIFQMSTFTYVGAGYYHLKTNITMTNIMFMFEAIGYNYGANQPIRCSWCGYGYTGTNDIYNPNVHTAYPGITAHGVYKSSDGYACLRASTTSEYYVGFGINAYTTAPAGFGFETAITAGAYNSTAGNYY